MPATQFVYPPVPVVTAGDAVYYIFGFTDAGAAGRDPVVGTFRAQEVLIYFTLSSSVVPYAGYQPMVVQTAPVNPVLYDHPNLLMALDLANLTRGESAVLKTVFSAVNMANMQVLLDNYGTFIWPGLIVSGIPPGALLDDTTGAILLDDTTGEVLVADS